MLGGATIRGTDRIGKLLLVDVGDDRPELGLRFGMTGRLVLGEHDPVGQLEYSPGATTQPGTASRCASMTAVGSG
ncbi:MAG: DNA-formamidopyrimidine glycosylase family protein [Acidimicrobiales bacterium]